jgi:hypothetical protein
MNTNPLFSRRAFLGHALSTVIAAPLLAKAALEDDGAIDAATATSAIPGPRNPEILIHVRCIKATKMDVIDIHFGESYSLKITSQFEEDPVCHDYFQYVSWDTEIRETPTSCDMIHVYRDVTWVGAAERLEKNGRSCSVYRKIPVIGDLVIEFPGHPQDGILGYARWATAPGETQIPWKTPDHS